MSTTPLPCETYRHAKTAGLYRIVCIASVEAVYQSEQDRRCWTRPLEEFMDGRFEWMDGRFEVVKDAAKE